jgi:hypothetical protein
MNVDPTVKDKMPLVPGMYTAEIINAKEQQGKNPPNNQMVMVEYKTIAGPDYENGQPSTGHELTEWVTIEFSGREGKAKEFMQSKLQDFVAGLDKTMAEFADMDAEDLIGEQINLLVDNVLDKRNGKTAPGIVDYSVVIS